jgi:Ca2+-binding EF-hand superfamily protein
MDAMTRLNSLINNGSKQNSETRLEGFNLSSSGGLDFQEVQKYVEQKRENERSLEGFQEADLSGDGEITLEELRALKTKMITEQFNKSEKDDGLVKDSDLETFFGTTGSQSNRPSDVFNPADIDDDGEFSLDELEALRRR